MQSLKELYKVGNGPSSSHTIGPRNAALYINEKFKNADYIKVYLFGSLALTGKGHLTNKVIEETLNAKCDIIFDYLTYQSHPNTMIFEMYKDDKQIAKSTIISVGGGAIEIVGDTRKKETDPYIHNSLQEVIDYCQANELNLAQYVYKFDSSDIKSYLSMIYDKMIESVNNGLEKDGILPGKLKIERKAKFLFNKEEANETSEDKKLRYLYSYAYAVSEENASGGIIVTAPTCGSSGVVPAVLMYLNKIEGFSKSELVDSLAVAGLIGNIVKKNGSISGAEAGCQAEVGVACAMAAAMYAFAHKANIFQVGQSAEIALEHHLGLTCDPILGYVQIPCIERNAVASIRAIDAYKLAKLLDSNKNRISFDLIIQTMLETGKDLQAMYRETSQGGLAKLYTCGEDDED